MRLVNIIIICLISLLLLAGSASAVAFGASPATLSFELPKGGSDAKTITVSTASEEPLDVTVSISNEIKDFITYNPSSNLKVDIENPLKISVLAKAPRFARSGVYEGFVTASTAPPDADTGGTAGSVIATGVAVKTTVKIGQTTATPTVLESDTEPAPLDTTPRVQETVPLSSGGSGSTLIVFVVIIIIGCLVLVTVKFSKGRKKRK